MPGQQIADPIDRVIRYVRQHIAQISLRIDAIEFGTADERVHRGGALAAAVGAQEHKILAPQGQSPSILPISGKKWKSIIGGIRCTVVG